MLPRHPRLRPALEAARPADFTGARDDPVSFPEPWSIEFGGSPLEWRNASIITRWRLPDRREIVEVDWYAEGHWTETYFADPEKMRRRWLVLCCYVKSNPVELDYFVLRDVRFACLRMRGPPER